jgi:hypothetical protein
MERYDSRRDGGNRNGGTPRDRERDERDERRYERGEVGEAHTGAPERGGYGRWENQGTYGGEHGYGERHERGWGYEPPYERGAERDRSYDAERGFTGERTNRERPRWQESGTPSSGTYGRGEWGSGDRSERGSGYRDGPGYRDNPYDSGWRPSPQWGTAGWRQNEGPERSEPRFRDSGRGMWGTQRLRRGKPPRNYRRSDDRIQDDVCELIARDTDIDASEVEIQVAGGEVTLTGLVEDRAAKRELEDVVERVFGVVDIHNNLRVRKSFFNQLGERLFGPNEQSERTKTPTPSGSSTTTKM